MENGIAQIAVFAAFLYSVVLHEVAHGYVAEQKGDSTARYAGRLTLNPIRHLDPVGSFLLPLVMFFTGGPIFGWAKPVPYNPNLMRDRRWDPLKVMAAGPGTNIALAIVVGVFLRLLLATGVAPAIMVQILAMVVYLNLILAVFNLIPIPPFDGRFLLGLFSPVLMFRAEI
ncbi:MAG TPA: site-2 protease family protein, partial [Candidatus Paceibacterota bacterium]|nr:site-2 protease family protein [Candidatus Paceibacterota bacterium]